MYECSTQVLVTDALTDMTQKLITIQNLEVSGKFTKKDGINSEVFGKRKEKSKIYVKILSI
jgi:hypothetical protein